jgi:hypothetical protein
LIRFLYQNFDSAMRNSRKNGYFRKTSRNKFVSRLLAILLREGFNRRRFSQEKILTGESFNRS